MMIMNIKMAANIKFKSTKLLFWVMLTLLAGSYSVAMADTAEKTLTEQHKDIFKAAAVENDPALKKEIVEKLKARVDKNVLVVKKAPAAKNDPAVKKDTIGKKLPKDALVVFGKPLMNHSGKYLKGITHGADENKLVTYSHFSRSGSIICWDIKAAKQLWSVVLNNISMLYSVVISPDGKTAVALTYEATIFLDMTNGKLIKRFPIPSSWIGFLKKDNLVVTRDKRYNLVVWDSKTGKSVYKKDFVYAIALSGDGTKLALTRRPTGRGAISTILILEPRIGKVLQTITLKTRDLRFLAISNDGSKICYLTSNSRTSTIEVHDLANNNKMIKSFRYKYYLSKVSFAGTNDTIIAEYRDGAIRQWNINTGKTITSTSANRQKRPFYISSCKSMKITAMDHYGTISFWDMRTGQRFSQADRHTGSVNVVRFLPESRKLLSGGEDGTMRLWDIDSGKLSKIITTRKTPIQDILLSRDGKTIAISDSSAEISIRKLTADETLSRDGKTLAISDDPSRIIARQIVIGGVVRKAVTQMPMRSLYYSPDEKYLYASMSDATLARWENFAPDSYRSLGIADVGGSLVSARPESAWLTCAKSNKLRIVDLGLKTFTELPLQLLSSSATTKHKPFAMSPTGLFVAAITKTHLVIIETASGKIIQQFPSKAESTFSTIKFFGKGRLLAAGLSNGHISIFDLAEGKLVTTLETTSTPTRLSMISDISFSTNGDLLASATCDSTVTIWNIAKYTKLKKITAPAEIARDPWTYLSDDDPITANNAAWLLSSGDDTVIDALEPHLTPARASTADEIALLIKKLDSIKFAQRQNAYKRLEDMGPIPENSMKKALESNPSPESTVLLENLLAGMNRAVKSTPIKLGKIRAIGVLEQIATNQAIKILKKLASGDPAARVTKDAKGALARINARKVRKN